jgi:hypothetical protein
VLNKTSKTSQLAHCRITDLSGHSSKLQPTATATSHVLIGCHDGHKYDFSHWEAMKHQDKLKFVVVMDKEVNNHTRKNHWDLLPQSAIDPNNKPLQAVRAMKRKCIPGSGLILKYKPD